MAMENYPSVVAGTFVKIDVAEYRTSSTGTYAAETLAFSDFIKKVTIDSTEFTALGNLMSITDTQSELRTSSNSIDITISGVPNTAIYEIVNSKIKNSPVTIYRAFFDPLTMNLISFSSNPTIRYKGFINNYAISEQFNTTEKTSETTIVFECASNLDVISNKVAGRKTNPRSFKKFNPNDTSMDRVPALERTYFDFGVPK